MRKGSGEACANPPSQRWNRSSTALKWYEGVSQGLIIIELKFSINNLGVNKNFAREKV